MHLFWIFDASFPATGNVDTLGTDVPAQYFIKSDSPFKRKLLKTLIREKELLRLMVGITLIQFLAPKTCCGRLLICKRFLFGCHMYLQRRTKE